MTDEQARQLQQALEQQHQAEQWRRTRLELAARLAQGLTDVDLQEALEAADRLIRHNNRLEVVDE